MKKIRHVAIIKKYNLNPSVVFIFTCVLLLLFTFFLSGFSTSKPKTFKVMSYNIHYGIGMDKVYDLERIAKVITDQDPDIVGLQEIGDSIMAATLGKLTGMHYVFGPSKKSMKGYGDAVLSKHPFIWVGNYSIPSASSSRYQVMGVDVDLSSIYGKNTKVRFLNTHFDWTQSIGSQEARMATVDVIERGFFKESVLPSILTGDLNAIPNSEPLKKLNKKGWITNKPRSKLFTIPVLNPKRQIDYVLVRPRKDWKIIDAKVLDEPVASDHLPIIMVLELRS